MSDTESISTDRLLHEPRLFKRGEYIHIFEQQKQLENYGGRASRKRSVPEPWKSSYQTMVDSPARFTSSSMNSPISSRPVSAQPSRASSPPTQFSPFAPTNSMSRDSPVKLTTVSAKKTNYNHNEFTVDHFSGFIADEAGAKSTRKKKIDTKPSEVVFGSDVKSTVSLNTNQQQQRRLKGMYHEQEIAEKRQLLESAKQETKQEMKTLIQQNTKNLLRKDLDLSKNFSQVQPHFHEPRKDWDLKQMNYTIAGKPVSDESQQPPAPKLFQPRISIEKRRAKEYSLLKIP